MLRGVYLPACSLQDIDSPHLLCMGRFSLQLTNLTGHLMDHTIATQTRMLSLGLLGSQTQVTDLFICMEMPEYSCSLFTRGRSARRIAEAFQDTYDTQRHLTVPSSLPV